MERGPVRPVLETPVRVGGVQRGGASFLPRLPALLLVLLLAAAGDVFALEICGNCLDDDGNGLVDLADPACCAAERSAAMDLAEGRIAPGVTTSRLRLAATLGGGVSLSPDGQQVLLQLGTVPGGTFCASLPPSAFRGTSRRLRLTGDAVAGARGVRRMTLRRAANGAIHWRTRGRRVWFSTDERQGSLDIRLLLADATDPGPAPRCFAARAFFRPGPRGTLIAE